MKTKGVAYYKKKADEWFSKAVRMRDADDKGIAECITCGVKKHYKDMQAGHFVKRSVSLLRYDPENVNAQCMQCNVFKYGEQFAYAKALDDKYGKGTADNLHAQRYSTHKFTVDELKSIIEDCKTEIKFYEGDK